MWSEIGTAIGLVLVIEGVLYTLFPQAMRRMMAQALAQPEGALRTMGLAGMAVGVLVVWFIRG